MHRSYGHIVTGRTQSRNIEEVFPATAAAATAASLTYSNADHIQLIDSKMEERIIEKFSSWTGEHMTILRADISSHEGCKKGDYAAYRRTKPMERRSNDRTWGREYKTQGQSSHTGGKIVKNGEWDGGIERGGCTAAGENNERQPKVFLTWKRKWVKIARKLSDFFSKRKWGYQIRMRQINFDRVHKIGLKWQTRHRFIVAKFNPSIG